MKNVTKEVIMEGFAIYENQMGFFKIAFAGGEIVFFKKIHATVIDDFGTKTALTNEAHEQLCEYFEGKRKKFTVPYKLIGTEFQKSVWKALCDIPYGEVRSYKDVAIAVGNPKASRAIGMANNKNPITVIVPCHRVIGSSGKLVGYAGGLEMKKFLLDMETANK